MAEKHKNPPAKIETANWLSYFSFNWIQPLLIYGWVSSLLPPLHLGSHCPHTYSAHNPRFLFNFTPPLSVCIITVFFKLICLSNRRATLQSLLPCTRDQFDINNSSNPTTTIRIIQLKIQIWINCQRTTTSRELLTDCSRNGQKKSKISSARQRKPVQNPNDPIFTWSSSAALVSTSVFLSSPASSRVSARSARPSSWGNYSLSKWPSVL